MTGRALAGEEWVAGAEGAKVETHFSACSLVVKGQSELRLDGAGKDLAPQDGVA